MCEKFNHHLPLSATFLLKLIIKISYVCRSCYIATPKVSLSEIQCIMLNKAVSDEDSTKNKHVFCTQKLYTFCVAKYFKIINTFMHIQ